MEQEQNKNNFTIPAAIIIAGLVIAGAVFLTRSGAPQANIQNQTGTELPDIKIAPITAQDHILGNPSAKAVVVEYSDTECPYCKTFHSTMHQVINNFGKDGSVAWVYRHYPIKQLHPLASKEAEATECAAELGGNTGFWKFVDEIYATTTSNNSLDPAKLPIIANVAGIDTQKFQTCLNSGKYASTIDNAVKAAEEAGAHGTPYNVILLKNTASKNVKNVVNQAMALGIKPEWLYVTPDNKKIVMSGAMPYELVSEIIKVIITD